MTTTDLNRGLPEAAPRRMTTEEIALVRAAVAWRRDPTRKIEYDGAAYPYWLERNGNRRVAYDLVTGSLGLTKTTAGILAWYGVADVIQAVDLLVTYKFLPRQFSSAYRAGYVAGGANHWAWQQGVPDPEAYAARQPAGVRS